MVTSHDIGTSLIKEGLYFHFSIVFDMSDAYNFKNHVTITEDGALRVELVTRTSDRYYTVVESTPSMCKVLTDIRFYCKKDQGGRPYAASTINGRTVHLHHFILPVCCGQDVDHKDNDPLNNRIENLRYTSHRINRINAKRRTTNKSGINGLHRRKNTSSWIAGWYPEIHVRKTKCFSDAKFGGEEAAKQAAIKYLEEQQKLCPDYVEARIGTRPEI